MTKLDLAKQLYERWHRWLSRKEAFALVELVFDTIKVTLAEGESVKMPGFGTFTVRKKGPRIGRVITTGEKIPIEARKVVTFKPSLMWKEKVKNVDKEVQEEERDSLHVHF